MYTKLVFSPIGPHMNFTPGFGFTLLADSLLLVFFIKSSLVETKSCKSCGLIPSFIKLYQVASHFLALLKLGMKQGSQGQTRAQRQGDLKD